MGKPNLRAILGYRTCNLVKSCCCPLAEAVFKALNQPTDCRCNYRTEVWKRMEGGVINYTQAINKNTIKYVHACIS